MKITSKKIISVFLILVLMTQVFAFGEAVDTKITRAEFVGMVSEYFQWPHPSEYNDYWEMTFKQFNDVRTDDLYGKRIEAAYEAGIITADAIGNFNPNSEITK